MKKFAIIFFAVITICASGLSQSNSYWPAPDTTQLTAKEIKRDSLKRTVISLGYQPAIGGDLIGAGLYVHSLASIVGIYASFTGLRKEISGDRSAPVSKDAGFTIDSTRNWNTINFGITFETASNFFIYCGFSTGGYSDWVTEQYLPASSTGRKPYTVVTEMKTKKPGADFGAMYYAGSKLVRFGLQLGYNTSMKAVIAGIQMGFFIK